ncbi:extensin [Streptomyces sp. NPDC050095]|uniref:extensin n=1 Tax=unclassified Streptomyces TaxID=2593676 RepID=UPI00342315C0
MKAPAAQDAIRLLQAMTRVLCAVGVLALVFTTVNVTRFATGRDVPLGIAVLLDPMLAIALAGVLYVDARLATWGIRPPAWSTSLRWSAGCTAALMNSWESLWPDGQIGWPSRADPAAVLLHLTPALLLIGLTETIAAYRRTVTDLLERIGCADPTENVSAETTPADRSAPSPPKTDSQDDRSLNSAAPSGRSGPGDTSDSRDAGRIPGVAPYRADSSPGARAVAPTPDPGDDPPPVADQWARAVALDDAARAATGKPVSIWRLRTDLRIGPDRAAQIRTRLLSRHPNRPPPLS